MYSGAFVGTPDPVRSNWRKTGLKVDKRSTQYVRVPIRYGRLSESRGNTYTMVFSPELGSRTFLVAPQPELRVHMDKVRR